MIIQRTIELLKNFFSEIELEKIAKETSFIQRNRKITAASFFKAVFFGYSKTEECSLDFLRSILSEQNINVSKSSFHEKIGNNKAVGFMKKILEELCRKFPSGIIEYIQNSCKFTAIKVLDSTEIQLNNKLKEFKNKQNGPRCKLQAFLNPYGSAVSYDITKGNVSDQGYESYLDNVEKNDLILIDLGYFCIERFRLIMSKGAYFITRFKKKTKVMSLEGTKLNMDELLKKSTNKVDIPILLGEKLQLKCRLVAKKLTGNALKKRKQKLKRDAKRRGKPLKKQNETDLWSIYITNLEEETMDEIHSLYVLRWQVELFFKILKSKLSLGFIKHQNVNMAMVAIYSKLIAITIMMILVQTFDDIEISLYKVMSYFNDMVQDIFAAITNYNLKKCHAFLEKIKQFARKEQRKKRPSSLTNAGLGKGKAAFFKFENTLDGFRHLSLIFYSYVF